MGARWMNILTLNSLSRINLRRGQVEEQVCSPWFDPLAATDVPFHGLIPHAESTDGQQADQTRVNVEFGLTSAMMPLLKICLKNNDAPPPQDMLQEQSPTNIVPAAQVNMYVPRPHLALCSLKLVLSSSVPILSNRVAHSSPNNCR